LTIVFVLIFVVLNSIGKKKSYDKHYIIEDEEEEKKLKKSKK
jgi:hypothetical protein